jgi:diguanylate cyclase (GGDEF)-like protein
MKDRRVEPRRRILREAKIVFNQRGSVIDCLVRNFSATGACLEVATQVGVPEAFDLLIDDERAPRRCFSIWRVDNKIGVEFGDAAVEDADTGAKEQDKGLSPDGAPNAHAELDDGSGIVRGELLALRAALDEGEVGVVLLDAALRAQFINRAFRTMWRLPDAKAEARPSFATLMHHGAETGAYEIAARDLSAYVAERIEAVIAGDTIPRDLRLKDGQVIRYQCSVLPAGGRMLSYTYVTDIVRQSDELATLRAALDNIELGVLLLDADLNVQFMNKAIRRIGHVTDEQAERRPPFAQLLYDTRLNRAFGVEGAELEALIALRIAHVRAGESAPMDLPASNGRVMRSQCAILPNGGRMLTYSEVTDLVDHANQLEALARIDALTGIPNRRHFLELAEIEWNRFTRYQRPLSLMMVDIDRFKTVNDAFGHLIGDRVLSEVAQTLQSVRRNSDAVARIGGEEFAVLLPETSLAQAKMAAQRLVRAVSRQEVAAENGPIRVTISIGVAEAQDSTADLAALMSSADQALYLAKAAGRNRVETAAPLAAHALG